MPTRPLRFITEPLALRRILAVVAGLALLGIVVMTVQQISASLHPMPEGLDPFDPADAQAFEEYLQGMPPLAWSLAFVSELLGAFVGGLTAGWVAREQDRIFSGLVVAVALTGSVANWIAFPHPAWFIVGQLVGYPLILTAAWALLARGHGRKERKGGAG